MIPLTPLPPQRKMDEEEFYALGDYGPRLLVLSLLARLSRQDAPGTKPQTKPYRQLRPMQHPL